MGGKVIQNLIAGVTAQHAVNRVTAQDHVNYQQKKLGQKKKGKGIEKSGQKIKTKINICDRQPMVRASVTERWDQLQTGNNILVSQTFYTKIIV